MGVETLPNYQWEGWVQGDFADGRRLQCMAQTHPAIITYAGFNVTRIVEDGGAKITRFTYDSKGRLATIMETIITDKVGVVLTSTTTLAYNNANIPTLITCTSTYAMTGATSPPTWHIVANGGTIHTADLNQFVLGHHTVIALSSMVCTSVNDDSGAMTVVLTYNANVTTNTITRTVGTLSTIATINWFDYVPFSKSVTGGTITWQSPVNGTIDPATQVNQFLIDHPATWSMNSAVQCGAISEDSGNYTLLMTYDPVSQVLDTITEAISPVPDQTAVTVGYQNNQPSVWS